MPSMTQKQIKNRLIFSVASLGIHHGLHLAWHRFVERVEVPIKFFQAIFSALLLMTNLHPISLRLYPSPLKAKIAPLLFKESLLFVGMVKKSNRN